MKKDRYVRPRRSSHDFRKFLYLDYVMTFDLDEIVLTYCCLLPGIAFASDCPKGMKLFCAVLGRIECLGQA